MNQPRQICVLVNNASTWFNHPNQPNSFNSRSLMPGGTVVPTNHPIIIALFRQELTIPIDPTVSNILWAHFWAFRPARLTSLPCQRSTGHEGVVYWCIALVHDFIAPLVAFSSGSGNKKPLLHCTTALGSVVSIWRINSEPLPKLFAADLRIWYRSWADRSLAIVFLPYSVLSLNIVMKTCDGFSK